MANEFIARKGLIALNNSVITGSLIVSASGATNDFLVGTNKLFVSASGNIGIGTSTPATRLSIHGGYAALNLPVSDGLNLASIASSPDRAQIWWGDNTGWRLNFGTRDSSGNFVPRVTMVDTGNVGIGTSSPSSLLHVSKSLGDSILTLDNTGNGNTSGINFNRERTTGTGVNGASIFIDSDTSNNDALLYIQAQSTNANAGITSPLSAGNGVRLLLRGNYGIFSVENGASETFRINSSGNVGMGTTTPNAKLDVNGNAIITGSLTVTGTLIAQEFKAELVSSSIIYESGSTKFGDSLDDTHQRTGSLGVSGSLSVVGNTVVGGLFATNITGSNVSASGTVTGNAFSGGSFTGTTVTTTGNVKLGDATSDSHTVTGSLGISGSVAIESVSGSGDTALLVRGGANSPKMLMIHAEGGNSTTDVKAGIGFSNHGGSSWSSQAIGSLRRDSNGFGDLLFMLRNNTTGTDVTTSDEKMRITGEGRVGIGTTSPSASLHVSASGTTNDFLVGTNKLFVSASGNVGIGTLTPTSAKLQIATVGNGSASLDAAGSSFNGVHAILPGRIYVGAASTGYPQIMYNAVPSQSAAWRYAGNDTAWAIDMGGSNQMRFRYAGAGTAGNSITWNNIMVLSSGSGNVGIGTNTPSSRLHVVNSTTLGLNENDTQTIALFEGNVANKANFTILQRRLSTTVNNDWRASAFRLQADIDSNNLAQSWIEFRKPELNTSNNQIAFGENSGSTNQWMIIDNGNVGIGIATPAYKLDIDDNATIGAGLRVTGGGTGTDFVTFIRDVGGTGTISFNAENSRPQIKFIGANTFAVGESGSSFVIADDTTLSAGGTSGTQRLVINSSGNIGIGTSTPATRLSIHGGYATSSLPASDGLNLASIGGSPDRAQIWWGDNTGWRLNFGTRDSSGNFVPRVTMVDTGNVGIGTTSPSIRLEVSGSIGAPNFTSGFTGGSWRLDYSPASSSLEVDNLTVRGTMRVYELLINQIRATNGTLFVSSVGKVETVTGTSPTFFLSFDTGSGGTLGHGFAVGDIIRAQRVNPGNPSSFVYRCDLTVTGVSANGKFVTASLTGSTAPSGGMEFVRLGNTASLSNRQGTVYLTADDTNAPFIDVIDGVASHADWNTASGSNRLKTRMGRLNGITSTNFGTLSGYGFYASGSAFLEGGINATTGRIANWVISGNSITSSNLHLTSSNGGVIRMGATLPTSHTSGTGIFLSGSGQVLIGSASGHRIQFDGSNVTISSSNAVLRGQSVEISGSNFHLLNGNITASNVNLSGNITATTGNIGGFAITANALTGSGFYISGGAAATGFFISSSGFNVKGNGNITASAGRIGGFNITNDVLSGTGFLLSGSATGTGFFISSSGFNVKANGNITASAGRIGGFNITNDVLSGTGFLLSGSATGTGFFISSSGFNVKANGNITASAGRIGGFTITNDVLSGTGFLLSGSATGTGFFISSSGFNVKANGNITASAGLVGGWNLGTASLSQGDVNLLATSVSGGLFVTSGSERILTVGNFNNVTVSTSPGLFATASLFRSSSNGTATIVSSSNSLTISRLTSIVPTDFVTTTVTQSLGTIPAGRVLALAYTYADLTNYTSSAVGVTWNNTSPSDTSQTTLPGPSSNSTNLTPTTSSFITAGGISGGKGTLNFTASLVNSFDYISGVSPISPYVDNVVFKVYNKDNTVIYNGDLGNVSIPIDYYGNTTTSIKFEADVLWRAGEDNFTITSSLNITGITSDIFVPAIFSASISSSGGTSLINSYQHDSRSPYSKVYASSIPVPTQVTNAKLIFTVRQLGSGSAYTNLPSYKISDILVSADVPKVNISRNQAIFYNSPLQYMQWTTSSFDIKGAIDATSLTVRGTTNLLGPVNIEGDISAHPDIQGASSTGNSAGTIVQNLIFDAFGHTTGVSTTNLDSRYQPVGSYVTLGTDQTITGLKTISGSNVNGADNPDQIFPALNIRGGNNTQDTVGGIITTGLYAKAGDAISDGQTATTVAIYGAEGTTGGGTPADAKTYAGYFSGSILTTKTGSFAHILPLSDNTGTVGTSALTWANGQFTNFTVDSALTAGTITTTGNAKLGDAASDIHTVTGSLRISGSLQLAGGFTANIATQTYEFNNGNLHGVNELKINDPGEGIIFAGNTSGDITIRVEDDALDNRFRIFGQTNTRGEILDTIYITGSRVGMGINNPTKTFTVQINDSDTAVTTGRNLGGGGAGAGIKLENVSAVTNTYVNLDFRANTADGRIAFVNKGTNIGEFHFITDNGGSPASHVVIQDDGDVGIGTTSPTAKLQVVGQISGSSVRAAYNSSDGTAGISVTRTFLDGDGITLNTVTIRNGIITEWTQS
jgi:hypothetical protein